MDFAFSEFHENSQVQFHSWISWESDDEKFTYKSFKTDLNWLSSITVFLLKKEYVCFLKMFFCLDFYLCFFILQMLTCADFFACIVCHKRGSDLVVAAAVVGTSQRFPAERNLYKTNFMRHRVNIAI